MSDEARNEIIETAKTIAIALILALLIRQFLVASFTVEGHSMEPTLHDGERLLVYKLGYRFGEPERGDIIVFRYPLDPSRDFIKRVIGLPGDTIEIRNGEVYINGERVEEPYRANNSFGNHGPVTVGEGQVYVLGDNRGNSHDSRVFGPVPEEFIIGEAVAVFWPLQYAGWLGSE